MSLYTIVGAKTTFSRNTSSPQCPGIFQYSVTHVLLPLHPVTCVISTEQLESSFHGNLHFGLSYL